MDKIITIEELAKLCKKIDLNQGCYPESKWEALATFMDICDELDIDYEKYNYYEELPDYK